MQSGMSRLLLAALSVLVFGVWGGTASAQAFATPDGETMDGQRLAWARSPSVADMARFFPTVARSYGLARGLATVRCTSDARGRLGCTVVEEDPVEGRFGEAALRVMRSARVRSTDGYSPEGRSFVFTLRFGNWPAHLLPDKFQPTEWGLNWVVRPEMRNWNMAGQSRNEVYAAGFDCVARADGSLDCDLQGVEPEAAGGRFAEIATEAMARARVRRIDDRPLEGSPLRWVIAIRRQSN